MIGISYDAMPVPGPVGGMICSPKVLHDKRGHSGPDEGLKTLSSNLTIPLAWSTIRSSDLGGGHLCASASRQEGCRAVIILENGRTAAGPQEASLPAFPLAGITEKQTKGPPHGPGGVHRAPACFVVA